MFRTRFQQPLPKIVNEQKKEEEEKKKNVETVIDIV
jgi:hypothetical protein